MGVVLPDELAWVLDLIGITWPNVDEDEFREMADSMRDFACEIDNGRTDSLAAVQRLVAENAGPATEAFSAHWDKVSGKHLHNLAEGGRLLATALDGAAVVISGAKVAAIAQLAIMATEVIAAQAAAPLTFGLSELGALGATQATRLIVRRLLKEAEQQIVSELLAIAQAPIINALSSMAGDLAIQVAGNALGTQKGYDLSSVADSGVHGAKDSQLGSAIHGGTGP
ncbi:WXG100-like domain-containing protein [Streptomyces chrestomyceticus]|uniref:WXG100-like domain-containing protein n=1 Tax=Streptomyces chrestomyceticus TaxID=68185 RepID=UPI00067D3E37